MSRCSSATGPRSPQPGAPHTYVTTPAFLALWGLKYLFASSPFSDFLHDAGSGNLPAVSFVDPKFTVLDDGLGNDDHPHSDIRNGDAFLSQVFHAVAGGPKWSSTVLIITFDESASDTSSDLKAALLRLSADERLPLVLHFYLDLPIEEVARTLGVSPSAAKSRIYRAARRLRSDLTLEEVF